MLEDLRNFLERQRLFGVVIMPPLSENDLLARLCHDLGVRYTRMGSAELDDPDHLVASNDREAVREARRAARKAQAAAVAASTPPVE